MTRTILSLFDHSGAWSKPYADADYRVIQVDIKPDNRLVTTLNDGITYLQEDIRLMEYLESEAEDGIHGILIASPCTEFAGSGAQYWPAKDADGRTAAALALVDAGLRCVALYQPQWWALENPAGRLPRWIGPSKYSFNPCDFGKLMSHHPDFDKLDDIRARAKLIGQGEKLTRDEVRIVRETNAYTKKTYIWGNSHEPEHCAIEPVVIKDSVRNRSYSPIHWYTGGKSERTKELRSMTPQGFALAFKEANP